MADKIGRFEVQGEIARTQLGCIYKASDPDSGQTVALKTVNLELLGERSAALVQGFKLDRIEIGIVIQQGRIFHTGGYTISLDPGQHIWPSWRSRFDMGGAHLRRRLSMT